jgi:hypothetical protein
MARVLAASVSCSGVGRGVGDLPVKVEFARLASSHLLLEVLVLFQKVEICLFDSGVVLGELSDLELELVLLV